jgi:hypothetical protein
MLKMGHGLNGVVASHLPAMGVAATLLSVACVTAPDQGPDLDNDGSAGYQPEPAPMEPTRLNDV